MAGQSLPLAKAKPQTSHLNGLSPECSLLWDHKEEYLENVPSQTLQWKGFSWWWWWFAFPPAIENTNRALDFLKRASSTKKMCSTWSSWDILRVTKCNRAFFFKYLLRYVLKRSCILYHYFFFWLYKKNFSFFLPTFNQKSYPQPYPLS